MIPLAILDCTRVRQFKTCESQGNTPTPHATTNEQPAKDTASPGVLNVCQTSQTTPMSPATGTDTSPFGFGSPHCKIKPHVWATYLDRILVLSAKINGHTTIWLRLIGSDQALNIKLNAPMVSSPMAAMEVSAQPKPDPSQDLAEYNVGIRGCFFADPCAFLHQHSLDKSTSRGYTAHERGIETLLWAFVMSPFSPRTEADRCTGPAFALVWRLKMPSR